MKRMWINQPSTLQPFHKLHGARVLAEEPVVLYRRIWFTSGDVVSMEIHMLALSPGWPQNHRVIVETPAHNEAK